MAVIVFTRVRASHQPWLGMGTGASYRSTSHGWYPVSMPETARPNADAVRFGSIIRRLRQERGWTLGTLARRCGMNPTYLGVLEKGGNVPGLQTIFALADSLDVEAAEIIRELDALRREAAALRQAKRTQTAT